MKKIKLSLITVPLLVSSMMVSLNAEDTQEGFNIFDGVKVKGEIRPRWENADVKDNDIKAGNAYTVRTTLGINAELFNVDGLSTYIEGTSVNNFGANDYSTFGYSNPNYDTILDSNQARITQAYIDYKLAKTTLRGGRQLVNLDDQRFVGSVGWRQMFQTFDAVSVISQDVQDLTLLGSYIYNVNGIAPLDPQAKFSNTNSVILNAKYSKKFINVTGFGYLLADVHDTYGVKVDGVVALGDNASVNYNGSYAIQKDATLDQDGNDNQKISANYYNAEIGANAYGFLIGADYEVLGEGSDDSTDGFSTPLATLHKFQGFADVFVGRTKGTGGNKDGLVDMNAKVGYKNATYGKFVATYHKFDSVNEGTTIGGEKATDLGSEIDFVYTAKIKPVNGLSVLLKGAMYTAADDSMSGYDKDKQVGWVQLDYKF